MKSLEETLSLMQAAACLAFREAATKLGDRSISLELCGGSYRVSRVSRAKLKRPWASTKSCLTDRPLLPFSWCRLAVRPRGQETKVRLPKKCYPQPCMSNAYPRGLPPLRGLNLERVTKAQQSDEVAAGAFELEQLRVECDGLMITLLGGPLTKMASHRL
jgi:hypothetical protein